MSGAQTCICLSPKPVLFVSDVSPTDWLILNLLKELVNIQIITLHTRPIYQNLYADPESAVVTSLPNDTHLCINNFFDHHIFPRVGS